MFRVVEPRGEDTSAAARLAVVEKARRLTGRELKWLQVELEHATESLQRARRQRARLRDQVGSLSDALADSLSTGYWSSRPAPGRIPGRVRGRGVVADPEADLVREVEACELFDGGWYLRTNPKVVAAGVAPALHYVRHGNSRRLDPGPEFSTSAYLGRHPDVADSGLPALLHAARHDLLHESTGGVAEPSPAGDVHL
jgi:hypothetical protein